MGSCCVPVLCCLLLAAPEPVTLTLRSRATVGARIVTVGDVAELAGGPQTLRDRVARLDVGELAGEGGTLSVSRSQLIFRLRLADVPDELCRVTGAESSQVSGRFRVVTADEVAASVKKSLLATLPWPPEEVQVTLAQPIVVPLPRVAEDDTVSIKAEIHGSQRPPGRIQMDASIYVRGENRLSLPVYFEVRPCVRVVVCRSRIDRGEALSEANVYQDVRPVDHRSSQVLNPTGMAGKKVRQTLLPGQVVMTADVEGSEAAPVLVRAQDAVRLQVRIGALRVTAAGQALQGGTQGQLIRVENIDSKKVLLGRVIERGLVDITEGGNP